jgi:hypothetical protein
VVSSRPGPAGAPRGGAAAGLGHWRGALPRAASRQMSVPRCREHEVVELQISVDDAAAVHVRDAAKDLHHVPDGARLGHRALAYHQVEQLAALE